MAKGLEGEGTGGALHFGKVTFVAVQSMERGEGSQKGAVTHGACGRVVSISRYLGAIGAVGPAF